jgi:hypothetical protein
MSDNSTFNIFPTNRGTFGPREFLESNSLVAKFAFLMLVIFLFIVLLRVGIQVIAFLLKPNSSPHLMDGMVDATQLIVYPQDPQDKNALTIYRSVNANDGVEFTWSVWVYITNLQYLEGQYRHIFHKGNSNLESNGLNFPNNAPGLYIAPNSNDFVIIMNTYNVINEEIIIPDIPINKWVNVIMRCQNTKFDVYINGTITRSLELNGVPKQNYGNVFVAMNGGFEGYISNLWYYNYALGTAAITKLVNAGPNTRMIGSGGMDLKKPNYLSVRWFFYGDGDMYNPGPNSPSFP